MIVLTNTLGDQIGPTLRQALVGGRRYPRWPAEICRTQYAGYFMLRMGFNFEEATNQLHNSLLEDLVADSLTGGNFRTNYSKSLQTNFQSDPAYLMQGIAREHTNDFVAAIAEYNQAIEWDPADAWAYCHRGFCKYRLKDYENAMADLSKAIELDPCNSIAWNHRAIARFHFKDYEASVKDCTKAIELNPGFYGAYANRAYAKLRLGDFQGALADANSCINPASNYAYGFWTRSRVRFYLEDYENALADCAEAIKINPRYGSAYASRGYIQQKLGQDATALESFKRALEFEKDLDYVRFLIWVLRSKTGEGEAVTEEIRKHLQTRPQEKTKDWSYTVESFLAGSINQETFLQAANTLGQSTRDRTDHICEANYYAGIKELLSGQKENARKLFQDCIATGDKSFLEYSLAQSELHALETQK